MKRLIGIVLALLLVAPVSAQSPQIRQLMLKQMPAAAAAAAFTGILDIANIPTPILAYGAHCAKSSYVGNVIDVFSVANSTVMATLTCSTGGVIGATGTWTLAQVKSNCTATHDCFAVKFYDQSGSNFCSGGVPCNSVLGNTTNSPWLVTADGTTTCGSGSTFANSGTFCLQTNTPGTPNIVSAALGAGISQPISYLFTYATLSTNNQGEMLYNSGSTVRSLSDASGITATLNSFAGSTVVTVAAAEAQWHTALITQNGASSYLQADNGTASTTNPGTGTIASGDTIGMGSFGGFTFLGFLGDMYVFSGTSISTAAAAAYANEKAYWGGGMP